MSESPGKCEKSARQPLLNHGVSAKENGPESASTLNPGLTNNTYDGGE